MPEEDISSGRKGKRRSDLIPVCEKVAQQMLLQLYCVRVEGQNTWSEAMAILLQIFLIPQFLHVC